MLRKSTIAVLAATLAIAHVGGASALVSTNGVRTNGIKHNGVKDNGARFNGVRANGGGENGQGAQGVSPTGAVGVTVIAIELPQPVAR